MSPQTFPYLSHARLSKLNTNLLAYRENNNSTCSRLQYIDGTAVHRRYLTRLTNMQLTTSSTRDLPRSKMKWWSDEKRFCMRRRNVLVMQHSWKSVLGGISFYLVEGKMAIDPNYSIAIISQREKNTNPIFNSLWNWFTNRTL